MFRNLDCLACNWITFSSFRIIGPCLRFTLTKLFRLVPLTAGGRTKQTLKMRVHWDFLELNGKAASEHSSTMQGDGSITLKSSRDEAVLRKGAHFRGAPDTPSPTLSQKTEPDTGDRAFREVLARLKEAQHRAAADGAAAGGVFRAMGVAALGPGGGGLPTMRMSAGSGSAFSLSVRPTT